VGVLELLWLVFTGVSAWLRPRHDLVAENLLLRHQLAVLTGRLEPGRALGFVPETSSSGCWLADGVPAGASTWRSSRPRRSYAGTGKAGGYSGVGSPAREADVRISVPKSKN
jgi:hypothetical protein